MSIKDELQLNCGGKCTGACCKVAFLPLEDLDRARWVALHGIRVFRIRETGQYRALIEKKCSALTGKNKCSIYENRPDLCRRYECADLPTYDELTAFLCQESQ